MPTFSVRGVVRGASGEGIEGADVSAARVLLRREEVLGTATSSADGSFEISYDRGVSVGEPGVLVVRAAVPGEADPLVSEPVPIEPEVVVDVQPDAPPAQFAKELAQLSPWLDGIPLTDVQESDDNPDVTFLADRTGLAADAVRLLVLAHHLEAVYALPAEVFFAFLAQGLPPASAPRNAPSPGDAFPAEALIHEVGTRIVAMAPEQQRATLLTAADRHLVSGDVAERADETVERLQARRCADTLNLPFSGGAPLRELLAAASLPEEKFEAFADAWINAAPSQQPWEELTPGDGLTAGELSRVRRTLEIGSVTGYHIALVTTVLRGFDEGRYTHASQLAWLSVDDWKHLIDESGNGSQHGYPSGTPGMTDQERASAFAAEVFEKASAAYPSAAMVGRALSRDTIPAGLRPQVSQFFTNNPGLDLRRDNLGIIAADDGRQLRLTGIPADDQRAVLAQVRQMQRVIRLAPDPDTAVALLDQGIGSAAQTYSLGREQLVSRLTDAGISAARAESTFHLAEQRYATLLTQLTRHNAQYNQVSLAVLPRLAPVPEVQRAIAASPTLSTLFGSQDYCDCPDCGTVLGPAAYLTDLLAFLKDRKQAGAFPDTLSALFARRPDIGTILLNCANATTRLPYIDLVCELLEDALAPPHDPAARQTTWSEPDLRAYPEYLNAAAYDVLANATYPRTLPYSRWLDEARTNLAQLGVPRQQLMEAFQPRRSRPRPAPDELDQRTRDRAYRVWEQRGEPLWDAGLDWFDAQRDVLDALAAPTDADIAAESFGLTAAEQDVIVIADPVAQPHFWGVADLADLGQVSLFLDRSGLDYTQLGVLLGLGFIRDSAGPSDIEGVSDDCNTDNQTITNLSAERLDKIHRLLRISRHTSWQLWELDLLLNAPAIGNGNLDIGALTRLHQVLQLQDRLNLATDQLAAFYAPLGITGHSDDAGGAVTPLYARLFTNPAVTDPPDPALAIGNVTAGPPWNSIADHQPALAAGLQLTDADLTVLAARTDGRLTLDNISALYRSAALARVLGLPVTDLIQLLALPEITDPFTSPAATGHLLDAWAGAQAAGAGLSQLSYLLTNGPSPLAPDDMTITGYLGRLRDEEQKTHDDVLSVGETVTDTLPRRLALIPELADPIVRETARQIIVDDPQYRKTEQPGQRDAFIDAHLAGILDPAAAKEELAALPDGLTVPDRQAKVQDRCIFVLTAVGRYLSQADVQVIIASTLGLPADLTALLLSRLRVAATATSLLDALSDPSLIAKDPNTGDYLHPDITPDAFPAMFEAIRRLHKAGVFARVLRLSAAEAGWLLDHASALLDDDGNPAGISPQDLPILDGDAAISFGCWLATSQFLGLARRPGGTASTFYDLVADVSAGADLATTQAMLAGILSAAPADLAKLHSALVLEHPADYQNPAVYQQLIACLGLAARAGVSPDRLAGWAQTEPTAADAAAIRQAAKARMSADEWLQAAPGLEDPVRDRSRHALVDYLVANPNGASWHDPAGLFDHFLIDTQIGPGQVTSRTVQASVAVQLFVQRCLMNLEDGITADSTSDGGWSQWDWMQRYQLWAANRQVFLYPENWLLEGTRPGKSQIFREFEDELSQHELTADNAETALSHYLQKLEDIGNLSIRGLDADPQRRTMHVVGQSPDSPPRFFDRHFNNGIWTPWQTVDVDIKAAQVLPVTYRSRSYLIWMVINSRPQPDQYVPAAQQSGPNSASNPDKYSEIQFAWTVYRDGKWAAAQFSEGRVFDIYGARAEVGNYSFISRLVGQEAAPTVELDIAWYNPTQFYLGQIIGQADFTGHFANFRMLDIQFDIGGAQPGHLHFPSSVAYAQLKYGPAGRSVAAAEGGWVEPRTFPTGLHIENGLLVSDSRAPGATSTRPLYAEDPRGPLLQTAPIPLALVTPNAYYTTLYSKPFFFHEGVRNFLVYPTAPYYVFTRHYHPFAAMFDKQLETGGMDNLFTKDVQLTPQSFVEGDSFNFSVSYQPNQKMVSWDSDTDVVDFAATGAYGIYNWELFYHAPVWIAEQLMSNQKFEDARRWFHFVFNPTRAASASDQGTQRYWITKPFHELSAPGAQPQTIEELLLLVNERDPDAEAQVQQWRNDPFDPFAIADLRPIAYMKSTVMRYLDNLIAWGDYVFRTADSPEGLAQATLLYVLAQEILGPRPRRVPPPRPADKCYNDVASDLDEFSEAMVDVENLLPATDTAAAAPAGAAPLPRLQTLHTFLFKIPPNTTLLSYWDTVAARLAKVRAAQVSLFGAPVDVGQLVQAVGAGEGLAAVVDNLGAPLPYHRFAVIHAKAAEFCAEVKTFGAALLSALEKKDAEGLAALRSGNELNLLTAAQAVREANLQEATDQLGVLQKSLALANDRQTYYSSRPYMNTWETVSFALSGASVLMHTGALVADVLAGVMFLIPDFHLGASGFGGTPHITAAEGGSNAGPSAERGANGLYQLAALSDKLAALASVQGSYQRRADDWAHQATQAGLEIDQINAQITAATDRQTAAQKELDNHQLNIAQTQAVDDYLHTKFTNQQLYDFMASQLSGLYFQSYQLALDLARRAEQCFRYELMTPDASFISPGYWDDLRQGLLAGERLGYDLRRMETAYLDLDRRRLELTRHVSLALTDPVALEQLKATGRCEFDLPETLFDLDYPGHYQRRLKSVALSVPAVVGPYSGVNCTLTLLANSARITESVGNRGYPRQDGIDARFADQLTPVQSIATSSGQNDSGTFEVSFQDPRYLPFEGAGAISHWQVELPQDTNDFDLSTLTDLVLHVRYTALDGGPALRDAARTAVIDAQPREGTLLLSAQRDYPDAWVAFLNPSAGADQELVLGVTADRFPFFTRGRQLTAPKVEVFVVSTQDQPFTATGDPLLPGGAEATIPKDSTFGDLNHRVLEPAAAVPPGTWTLKLKLEGAADYRSLTGADLDDVVLAVHYQAQ
jgi:hypothetical protein